MTAQASIEPAAEMAIIISPRAAAQGLLSGNEDQSKKGGSAVLSSACESTSQTPARSPRSHSPVPHSAVKESSASRPSTPKKVMFNTVRIHEHRLTLGDNPGVSLGVPLTLGWEYNSDTLDLEAFERLRCGDQEEPGERSPKARRMCLMTRIEIASENHSRNSILKSAEEVLEIQKSRLASIQDRPEFMSQREDRRNTKVTANDNTKEQRVVANAAINRKEAKGTKQDQESQKKKVETSISKSTNNQAEEERVVAKVTDDLKDAREQKKDEESKDKKKKKKAVTKVIQWLRQDKGMSKQVQPAGSNNQDFHDI